MIIRIGWTPEEEEFYSFSFDTLSTKPCFIEEKKSMPLSFMYIDVSQRLDAISLPFTDCALNEATTNGCLFCFFLLTPVVVVVNSFHQSRRCGVSRFQSAQSIKIPLSVWSASILPAHLCRKSV